MGVDERRWVVQTALTILGMVCALAVAGEALHHHGGRAAPWVAVAVFVGVAVICLHDAVRAYRRTG